MKKSSPGGRCVFLFVFFVSISHLAFTQNAPLYLWGPGLNGTTYQKFALYADTNYGLLFEAPLDASGTRLNYTFSWRGGVPQPPLFISGATNFIGVGTSTPAEKLHINGGRILATDGTFNNINLLLDGNNVPIIRFTRWTGGGNMQHNAYAGQVWNPETADYAFGIGVGSDANGNRNAADRVITIPLNKNVGIGTSAPDQKLTVNGKIKAEEILVVVDVADYVFESDYQLMPLEELEKFVREHRHLPGVPGKAEVDSTGFAVGKMTNKILEKVEELSLHVIGLQKQIDALKVENALLKSSVIKK